MSFLKKVGKYCQRVLLGLDQFGNTLMGGYPDETISARTGRNAKKRGWRVLAKFLNTIDRNHVYDAIRSEQLGNQQDPYYQAIYTNTGPGKVEVNEPPK